jgi:hypothetical protein
VYQQQQQEEQQQDAENPFLDPPISRIKTGVKEEMAETQSSHCLCSLLLFFFFFFSYFLMSHQ